MKKVLFILFLFLSINLVFANQSSYRIVYDQDKIYYSASQNSWSFEPISDDIITLKKELFEGEGNYSKYYYNDGSLAFSLTTNCEAIANNELIIIDNNLLKFYKLIYENGSFKEIEIREDEVQKTFPQAEVFKLSQIDADDKIWLHKPFLKKRTLLLYNDTGKFFHRITCNKKNAQDKDIKGLITFSKYGAYRFKHYGKYNGKLFFYIR